VKLEPADPDEPNPLNLAAAIAATFAAGWIAGHGHPWWSLAVGLYAAANLALYLDGRWD
jgi:hypothetical protein